MTGTLPRANATPTPAGPLSRVERRVLPHARWILLISVIGYFALRYLKVGHALPVDLEVYRLAPRYLFTGDLYDFRYAGSLPFLYPPIAALLFWPMQYLPTVVLRYGWTLLSMVALWLIVRASLNLVSTAREGASTGEGEPGMWRNRSLLWTAGAIWTEPVFNTLGFGQVNLFLTAMVLTAFAARRPASSGLGIGLAAAIKLTPAVSVLYFLVRRRWTAAAWSAVWFAGFTAVSFLVVPPAVTQYFSGALTGSMASGTIPIETVNNQSLRGALTRTFDHDVRMGAVWLVAAAIAAAVTALAMRAAARAGDELALILAVQLLGLLISPVSWEHYWIWLVPLLVWSAYGAARSGRLVRVGAGIWLLIGFGYLVKRITRIYPADWAAGTDTVAVYPWYVDTLAWGYAAATLLSVTAIWVSLRSLPAPRATPPGA